MESELLDLVFIDETHLRKGNNVDLSAFAPWSPIFLERDFGMKMGGWENGSTLRVYDSFGMESYCRGK